MKITMLTQVLRDVFRIIAVAVAYYFAASTSLIFSFEHTNASAIWPASGIAIAAIWHWGGRVWPGIFLGAFVANFWTFLNFQSAVSPDTLVIACLYIASGNALEALLGGLCLRYIAGEKSLFSNVRTVFRFLFSIALVSFVSPMVGPTTICSFGLAPWSYYKTMWLTWYLGDFAGMVTVAPFLILIPEFAKSKHTFKSALELLALYVLMFFTSWFSFGGLFDSKEINYILSFSFIPVAVWFAFRFGAAETAGAMLIIFSVGVWQTIQNRGPFAVDDMSASLIMLQGFLALGNATLLSILGMVEEREQLENNLKLSNDRLTDFIENALIPIRLVGRDGRVIWANHAEMEMLGYKQAEYLGRHISELHADEKQAEDILAKLESKEAVENFEAKLMCKNGSVKDVLISSNAYYEDGEFRHMRYFTRDVTENKRAEEALLHAFDELEKKVQERTVELSRSNSELKQEIATRRIIEKELQKSREELQEFLDNMSTMSAKISTEGKIVMVNRIAQTLAGLTHEQLVGTNFLESPWWSFDPEVKARIAHAFHRAVTGNYINYDEKVKIASGEILVLNFSLIPVRDNETRSVKYLLAEGRNITAHKQVEQALRESEVKTRLILETANDAFVGIDEKGFITDWNHQAEITFGWTASEIMGKPLAETIIPAHYREAHLRGLEAYLSTGKSQIFNKRLELVGLHKEGRELPIELTVWPIKLGEKHRFNAFIRDISERKKAEEDLRKMDRQRSLILNSAVEGIYGVDREGRITFINPAASKMIGYQPDEVLGQNAHYLIHHTRADGSKYEWQNCPIYNALSDGEARQIDNEIVWRKDGSYFPVEYRSTPLIEGGRIVGAFVMFRDITYRKLKEELDIKSQFISVVSHELRTPLTVIKDSIGIVLDGSAGQVNAEQRDFLDTAKRNVDRLSRLISNVLNFQKLDSGRIAYDRRQHNINSLVHEIEKTVGHLVSAKGLELKLELNEDLPPVYIDKDYIMQVLLNLVDNAMKFTEKGFIRVKTSRSDTAVQLTVEDTGIGIKQQDCEKLFQSFSQIKDANKGRKTGGTGLGLVICKKIVEQHGGRLWIKSEYGKGSTFYIELPIDPYLKNYLSSGGSWAKAF